MDNATVGTQLQRASVSFQKLHAGADQTSKYSHKKNQLLSRKKFKSPKSKSLSPNLKNKSKHRCIRTTSSAVTTLTMNVTVAATAGFQPQLAKL